MKREDIRAVAPGSDITFTVRCGITLHGDV